MSLTAISSLGIGGKKMFHEYDGHVAWKVGINRFLAPKAEMTLKAITSVESREEIFHELDVHDA